MTFINTKQQGDWGLGSAIAHFTKNGVTVSLPLTDSQDYDLVADIEGVLKRIQIKSTTYKRYDSFQISLTVKGGNRTSAGTLKHMDPSKVDALFIVTSDDEKYLIPIDVVTAKSSLSLSKFEKYLVV